MVAELIPSHDGADPVSAFYATKPCRPVVIPIRLRGNAVTRAGSSGQTRTINDSPKMAQHLASPASYKTAVRNRTGLDSWPTGAGSARLNPVQYMMC